MHRHQHVYAFIDINMSLIGLHMSLDMRLAYALATVSTIDEIIGLFCRIASLL